MCFYVIQITMCGHWENQIFAGPNCQKFHNELNRINDPAAWRSADDSNAEAALPFTWPEACEPSYWNTLQSLIWCGWECRNTHDPWGLQECNLFPNGIKEWHGQKEPMGEETATYGEPRPGVGWRDDA